MKHFTVIVIGNYVFLTYRNLWIWRWNLYVIQRWSSLPEVFFKKRVLSNFEIFTGKHLCQSLFFSRVAGLKKSFLACNFIRFWHRFFPVNFAKFVRTSFLIENLRWLLLFWELTQILKRVIKVFLIPVFKVQYSSIISEISEATRATHNKLNRQNQAVS